MFAINFWECALVHKECVSRVWTSAPAQFHTHICRVNFLIFALILWWGVTAGWVLLLEWCGNVLWLLKTGKLYCKVWKCRVWSQDAKSQGWLCNNIYVCADYFSAWRYFSWIHCFTFTLLFCQTLQLVVANLRFLT